MSRPEGERTGSGTMPIASYRPSPDMGYEQRRRRIGEAIKWLLDDGEDGEEQTLVADEK